MEVYKVTLHSKEDLDSFYEDMETEGGNLYIPDRAVTLQARRDISRVTHYYLTQEEAEQIQQDDRVLDVEPLDFLKNIPLATRTFTGTYNKNESNIVSDELNWGFYRHTNATNPAGFGQNAQVNGITVTIPFTGENVDVIILDGHVDPTHPEYADDEGNSRVNQIDWFEYDDENIFTGTYQYTPINQYGDDHGSHVMGTAAGRKYGWAKDANIYNLSPYAQINDDGGNTVATYMYDWIRRFHARKAINPNTGRKNPTIVNGSFGSGIQVNYPGPGYVTGPITSITIRGVTNSNTPLSADDLRTAGIATTNTSPFVPFYSPTSAAEIADMIAEGVIFVAAAGNENAFCVTSDHPDYNNSFEMTFNGINYLWRQNRGTTPGHAPGVICVGSLSTLEDERRSSFSNYGNRTDVFAAGEAILSSQNDSSYTPRDVDPRDNTYWLGKIQGTSMASPQICGILACYLEKYPNLTPTEALRLIQSKAEKGAMRDQTNLADIPQDYVDLLGVQELIWEAKNIIPVLLPERPVQGQAYPSRAYKGRPETGTLYPRVPTRRN